MNIIFLEKDPQLSKWFKYRMEQQYPTCDTYITEDPCLEISTPDDLLIYTVEQFPTLNTSEFHFVHQMHSERPDIIHTIEEVAHENQLQPIIYKQRAPELLWQQISSFIDEWLQNFVSRSGITVLTLPSNAHFSHLLTLITRDRIKHCDHLLLVPIAPAYYWSSFCTIEADEQTLSDLLLDLSIRNTEASLPKLNPYICRSTLNCLTLAPPRHSDDLTTLTPELFRRFISTIYTFLEESTNETWEILIIHYAVPFALARISMSIAERYYAPDIDAHSEDQVLSEWIKEARALEAYLRPDCERLKFPQIVF